MTDDNRDILGKIWTLISRFRQESRREVRAIYLGREEIQQVKMHSMKYVHFGRTPGRLLVYGVPVYEVDADEHLNCG